MTTPRERAWNLTGQNNRFKRALHPNSFERVPESQGGWPLPGVRVAVTAVRSGIRIAGVYRGPGAICGRSHISRL